MLLPQSMMTAFLVTTTQRCGSTYLTRILERITGTTCAYMNCTDLGFALRRESANDSCQRLVDALTTRSSRVLKTHDLPSKDFDKVAAALPNFRLLTVHRDFKDVVVSRFFYYRYYWPSDRSLGALPDYLRRFYEPISSLPDRDAIAQLLLGPVLLNWAREWAAFEGSFSTNRALRLTYEQLTQGEIPSIRTVLEQFTGLKWQGIASFSSRQEGETYSTGRTGHARFNREGRSGQYLEWFDTAQIKQLDTAATQALHEADDLSAHDMY